MAVTTLLPDTTIRVDHAIDVAVHPDTRVPTRISTRPYRVRHRPAKGIYPDQRGTRGWTYRAFKYVELRDAEARYQLSHGDEVQVWDFPGSPLQQPIYKDRKAVEKRLSERGGWAWGADGKYWRFVDGEWKKP
jgi:hypothetical protein